jgi:hypothetical protein
MRSRAHFPDDDATQGGGGGGSNEDQNRGPAYRIKGGCKGTHKFNEATRKLSGLAGPKAGQQIPKQCVPEAEAWA